MSSLIRVVIIVLIRATGIFAGINPRQQELDCNVGGNNETFYMRQFEKNKNPFGTTFDGFCVTRDLVVSTCCIDDTNGSVIDGFEIYELNTWSPEPPEWVLRASDKSITEGSVDLTSNCLHFNRTMVMEGEKFGRAGKVQLLTRLPDKSVRNFSYISDLDDTPYSVWLLPPPMEMSRSRDDIRVTLANGYPFAYRDWQLCVCLEDEAHFECTIETEVLELSIPVEENAGNKVEICVGFAYAKTVGTFGPNRTCRSLSIDWSQYRSTHSQTLVDFLLAHGKWILPICGTLLLCFIFIMRRRFDLVLWRVKKKLWHGGNSNQQPPEKHPVTFGEETNSDYHVYASIDYYQFPYAPADSGYSSSLHGITASSNYISGHRLDPNFESASSYPMTAKTEGIMYQSAGETKETKLSSPLINSYSTSASEEESYFGSGGHNPISPKIAIPLSDYLASSSKVNQGFHSQVNDTQQLEEESEYPSQEKDAQSDQSEPESVDDLYKT